MRVFDTAYQTTLRAIADWRKRLLFARPRTLTERLLGYSVPALWAFAVVVGGAALFW